MFPKTIYKNYCSKSPYTRFVLTGTAAILPFRKVDRIVFNNPRLLHSL